MALYQNGILISGANTLPQMTLAEYNALPASDRPTYWERTDLNYNNIPASDVTYGSGSVEDALDGVYDVLKNRDYTLVRGNGVKTYSQLLNELYALVDWTKVNPKTTEFAISGMYWYKCAYTNSASGVYSFTYTNDTSTSLDIRTVQIKSTGSAVRFTEITSTISRTDMSSQVVANNTALAVYY